MRRTDSAKAPADAEARRGAAPTIVYPVGQLPPFDTAFYAAARAKLEKTSELTVPPRDASAFTVAPVSCSASSASMAHRSAT